ncbi:hypothetical protein [Bacillus cereus]|nr:hypothetical protein [Bacillus cereus]
MNFAIHVFIPDSTQGPAVMGLLVESKTILKEMLTQAECRKRTCNMYI